MPTQTPQERLQAFEIAGQNLRLDPLLTSAELNRFWVEYDPKLLEDLEQAVRGSIDTEKLLFTGHTGCGKSTLLSELRYRLATDYFVVLFSVSELIEMADINHINVLFTIATQLMEAAEEAKVAIKPSIKKQFYQWFGEHAQVETSQLEASLEAGYEAGAGLNIGDLIAKFWASVKGNVKVNAVIRDEIKTEFERKISDLINRINDIAAVIQSETQRPILIIVDGLDKLDPDLTDKVYRNNVQSLFQPQFRILYTLPIFVLRDVTLRKMLQANTDKIHTMQVGKFFAKGDSHLPNPTPVDPNLIASFEQILDRRFAHAPDLIEAIAKRTLILKSGGILRELIRLAKRCCDKCSTRLRREIRNPSSSSTTPIQIDEAIVAEVLTDVQIEFAEPLGQIDYDLLKTIYDQNRPQDAESQRFLDLLHGLYILEYRNAKFWYDLHPIVLDLLRQEDILSTP
jgi:energy-coupling factor transporter ATP-binding protein EcfA2